MIQALRDRLQGVQAAVNFESWSALEYPQFSSRQVRKSQDELNPQAMEANVDIC